MRRPFVYRLLWMRNDRQIPSPKQFLCFVRNSNEHTCVWYHSPKSSTYTSGTENWQKHQPCYCQRLRLAQMKRR